MNDMAVEVVELRGSGGLGLFLRIGSDQRLYRVAPVRDPRQPRFWCLAVFECSACGIPVSGSAIWAGWWGSAHQELSPLFDTIKADAASWLMAEPCAALYKLLQEPRGPLPIPSARVKRREPDVLPEHAVALPIEQAS